MRRRYYQPPPPEPDPDTPIWRLTVGQFRELLHEAQKGSKESGHETASNREYVHGLGGIAVKLGCSISKIQDLMRRGVLVPASIRAGRKIVFDVEKAISLLREYNEHKQLNG